MGHSLKCHNTFAALFYLFLFAPGLSRLGYAQMVPGKIGFHFISENGQAVERLLSNSIIDILPDSQDVLMGTGGGISVWHTADSTWSSFDESYGLGSGSVSALGIKNGVIWAATAYTASTSVGPLPAGGGVGYSADGGSQWTWYDQPVDPDSVTTYDPTTTNVQNVTYDLLITSTEVWIASWGGGLRKHSLADTTGAWQVVTPDTQDFGALTHLNHRAFSLAGDDSILWVGTAAGINKSTDGGQTWENFAHQPSGSSISGNFVTAMSIQRWGDHEVLWAATWPAENPNEFYGVSKSENGGLSWEVALTDSVQSLKAHNFAFDDSVVYVASNLGLHKSYKKSDGTWANWEPLPQIEDSTTGRVIYDPEVYCALQHLGTLWVGTGDGVAASPDLGNTWTIYRSAVPINQPGQPSTYSFPNPFSPRLSPFVVRFQYHLPAAGKVTVKVYDFAMDLIATVAEDVQRNEAGDYNEEWLGIRNDGKTVATGVYYYSVERSGASTVWGKVAVIY